MALAHPDTDLRLFGKPEGFKRRRMGVATARAENTDLARTLAKETADQVSVQTNFNFLLIGRPIFMINTSPLLNYVSSHHDIKAINQWRTDVEKQLQDSYENGQSIREIIKARSDLVDEALVFYGNMQNLTSQN